MNISSKGECMDWRISYMEKYRLMVVLVLIVGYWQMCSLYCAKIVRRQIVDSVFVLRACLYAKGECGIGVLPMPLVQYRIHPNQVSNSRNISLIKRMGIYRQYRDDIAVAIRNHYVPLGYMFSLFCWLGRYHVAALLQYNSLWHKLRRGRK